MGVEFFPSSDHVRESYELLKLVSKRKDDRSQEAFRTAMGTLYLDAKIKHQDYTRSDIAIEPATTVDGFEILSGILAGDDRDLADKCADYLLFINRDNSTTSTELAIIYFQADSELT